MNEIIDKNLLLSTKEGVDLIENCSTIKKSFKVKINSIDVGFGLFILSTDKSVFIFLETGSPVWNVETKEKILKAKFIDKKRVALLLNRGLLNVYDILQNTFSSSFIKTKENSPFNLSDFFVIQEDIYFLYDSGTISKINLFCYKKTSLSILPSKAVSFLEERELKTKPIAIEIKVIENTERNILVYYKNGIIDFYTENNETLSFKCSLDFKEPISNLFPVYKTDMLFFFRDKTLFFLSIDNPKEIKTIRRFDKQILSVKCSFISNFSCKIKTLLKNNFIVSFIYTKNQKKRIDYGFDYWKRKDFLFNSNKSVSEKNISKCNSEEIIKEIKKSVEEIGDIAINLNTASKEMCSRVKFLFDLKKTQEENKETLFLLCREYSEKKMNLIKRIEEIKQKENILKKRYKKVIEKMIGIFDLGNEKKTLKNLKEVENILKEISQEKEESTEL